MPRVSNKGVSIHYRSKAMDHQSSSDTALAATARAFRFARSGRRDGSHDVA